MSKKKSEDILNQGEDTTPEPTPDEPWMVSIAPSMLSHTGDIFDAPFHQTDDGLLKSVGWFDADSQQDTSSPQHSPKIDPNERYTKISQLGQGGMGVVWLGWDRLLERNVAIKEPIKGKNHHHISRNLMREAMMTAKLEHPAIVNVHDVFFEHDTPHFVMRLIRGEPLSRLVHQEDNEISELVRHVLQAADAIGFAHRMSVLHRDISPKNILAADDGVTYVIDWGLASSTDAQLDTSTKVGTPGFIAPEEAYSPQSDVWSLGALLHFVLHQKDHTSHPELDAIIEHAMCPQPEDRYANGTEFAMELRRWFEGRRIEAYDTTPWRQLRRTISIYKTQVMVVAVILLTFFSTLIWGVRNTKKEATRARNAESLAKQRADSLSEANIKMRGQTASLLLERAKEHLEEADILSAQQLLLESIDMKSTPEAHGILAHVNARLRPEIRILEDVHTTPCYGVWHLTKTPGLLLCHWQDIVQDNTINDFITQLSAFKHGKLQWERTFIPYIDNLHVDEDLARIDLHDFHKGERVYLDLDLHTGHVVHKSFEFGWFASTTGALRLLQDRSEILNIPSSKGICERSIQFAQQSPDHTVWIVCYNYEVHKLNPKTADTHKLRLANLQERVMLFLFDPEGKTLGITTQGDILNLQEGEHGSIKFEEPVLKAQHFPDRPWAALRGSNGTVRILNTQNLSWVYTLPGKYRDIYTDSNGRLRVFDGQRVLSVDFGEKLDVGAYTMSSGVTSVAWSREGDLLAALEGAGKINIIAPHMGKAWLEWQWLSDVGKSVSPDLSKDRSFLLGGIFSNGAWTASFNPKDEVLHTAHINPEAMHHIKRVVSRSDGKAVSVSYSHLLTIADPEEMRDESIAVSDDIKFDLDADASGEHILVLGETSIWTWQWKEDRYAKIYEHNKLISTGSINAHGDVVIVANDQLIWIAPDGLKKFFTLPPKSFVLDIEWVPGKPWVVMGQRDGSVTVMDLEQDVILSKAKLHQERVASVNVSADGRWLATGAWDAQVLVSDLSTLTPH